ncbi:hypothetical protein Tco_0574031 [Tanacetum coccineum]
MSIKINKKKELRQLEQAANVSTHTPEPSRCFNSTYYDDDDDEESIIPLNEIISQLPQSIAITPVLPTMEPEDSLIMEDEYLRTIPEKKSDEFIKSSVDDIVPIPSKSEDLSEDLSQDLSYIESDDDESLSDEDVPEENFKIYSNPLFDEEIISTKIDLHHFNVEYDLIESLLNRDTSIVSSPKFDSLLEEHPKWTPHRPQRPKKIMKSIWVKKESTVGSQAVLPQIISVKGSAMINPTQTWRSKGAYLDSVNRDNGSYTLKQFEYGNPEEDLKDYSIIDSGCSRSMTGDKDKLSDFKEFKGGYVAFGNDPYKEEDSGKGTIKT